MRFTNVPLTCVCEVAKVLQRYQAPNCEHEAFCCYWIERYSQGLEARGSVVRLSGFLAKGSIHFHSPLSFSQS